jgi:hypothetical protein
VIATLASIANGAIMPLFLIIFTNIIDSFTGYGKNCGGTSNPTNTTSIPNGTTLFTSTTTTTTAIVFSLNTLTEDMKQNAIYLISDLS